jgi:prophage regulatory protein
MNATTPMIRLPEAIQLTGLSKSSIYRLEKLGQFVPRVKLSARATGWSLAAINSWMENRAASLA